MIIDKLFIIGHIGLHLILNIANKISCLKFIISKINIIGENFDD